MSNQLGVYIVITDSNHCDVTIYFRTCEMIALFREALEETEHLLHAATRSRSASESPRSRILPSPPLRFVELGGEA